MAVEIPFIPSDPDYGFTTSLNGTAYTFDVLWNDRDAAWFFTLSDGEGDVIRAGIKVVLGVRLGDRSADPRWPAGVFFASDSSGQQADPGIDDLGARVRVIFLSYEDADDLATIAGLA